MIDVLRAIADIFAAVCIIAIITVGVMWLITRGDRRR
jgi:hypothetical protein